MKTFRLIINGFAYDLKVPWESAKQRKKELRELGVHFVELE